MLRKQACGRNAAPFCEKKYLVGCIPHPPPGVWGGMGMSGLPYTTIVDDGYTAPAWAMGLMGCSLMGCNKNSC